MPYIKMDPPQNLLKRGKELAAEGKNVAEIASICESEGILHPRTNQPFTYKSVVYWLNKFNIKSGRARGAYLKEQALKKIYTNSLREMGFDEEQIKKELKGLL